MGTVASAVLLAGSLPDNAEAYPIFAQQNYKDPREATGKLACANCHLASKQIDVRLPHEVLSDTIFKTYIDIPCKYEKRRQPLTSGEKGPLNVGAIAVMPEGWKLAPKNRLPKPIKKNGEPITTNPNVGGFGQEEKELVLQDMNRVYAYCAIGTSIFFAQLAFVLKKKQFEKVQLAEGF